MQKSQNSNRELDKFQIAISSLDLEPMIFKLMDQKEGEGWTEPFAREVERAYRRFLYLNATQQDFPIVPSKLVDEFWHYHILDTRKYEADCNVIFGKMLHHFPYFGLRGESDRDALNDAFHKTLKLIQEKFGDLSDFVESSPRMTSSGGTNICVDQSCSGNCQADNELIIAAVCGGDCSSGPCGDRVDVSHRPGGNFVSSNNWFEDLGAH